MSALARCAASISAFISGDACLTAASLIAARTSAAAATSTGRPAAMSCPARPMASSAVCVSGTVIVGDRGERAAQ